MHQKHYTAVRQRHEVLKVQGSMFKVQGCFIHTRGYIWFAGQEKGVHTLSIHSIKKKGHNKNTEDKHADKTILYYSIPVFPPALCC